MSLVFAILLQVIGAFFYPNGDSANSKHGPWSIRNSQPVLAFRAGPAPFQFLYLFAPFLATQKQLSPAEARCRLEWTGPPPSELRTGQLSTVRVRVTNLGPTHWSSLGGFANKGAVEIRAVWQASDGAGAPRAQTPAWLGWKLGPGQAKERDLRLEAAATPGSAVLTIRLEQARMGPFPASSCAPLQTPVEVEASAESSGK
jgi:hypothetical protein